MPAQLISEKLDTRIVRHFMENEAALLEEAYRRPVGLQDVAEDILQVCCIEDMRCRQLDSRGRNPSAPLFLRAYDDAEIAAARLSVNIVIMD